MQFKEGLLSLKKVVAKGATSVAKKSGELVEISKLNSAINSNDDKLYELYSQIGEIVYKKYKKTKEIDHDLKTICEDITEIAEENEKLTKRSKKLNSIRKCLACGHEMKLEVDFCPKCGLKQDK